MFIFGDGVVYPYVTALLLYTANPFLYLVHSSARGPLKFQVSAVSQESTAVGILPSFTVHPVVDAPSILRPPYVVYSGYRVRVVLRLQTESTAVLAAETLRVLPYGQ